ncbi:SDR family NAD(P)-dependent oxidoreductase [Sporosarcina aquimarina]|uniref:SDR family NAD(P)-dependent oxidoreductase n=1 Tax=Sporosarcina aquimarina TaxID=114975 RepID=A0ABU4FZ49_9BACL|nr:SDR family NAD(P)-dependent oxidoreductase [Sporosarcina aquimarina]MDW0109931.1 SDR family NAD(P)-dependent oxidoreductase [Sporosarcina aquimarina]
MGVSGKIAVITGGAKGIGATAARSFCEQGAQVAIIDMDEKAGETLAEKLHGEGYDAAFFKADVSNEQDVNAVASTIIEQFGKVDILINNAGITMDAMTLKMELSAFRKVLDVNVTGVFNCTKAFVPSMIESGSGRIISTSSVAGTGGNVGQANYAASKAAIIGMTKTWSKEFGPKGITANAVAPGFIETELTKTIPDKIVAQLRQLTPFPRFGTADDIANAYLFLASDEASFINGTVLEVDGGMLK